MAKAKTDTKARLISEFSKNSVEVIRVQFTEFKEQRLLDVRTWVIGKDGEAYIPTRKGISLRTEQVGELARGILKALEEIEKAEG